MRKRMNRILSVLLVSVLVLQAAEVAHAEDVIETTGEEVQVTEEVPVEVIEEGEPAEAEEVSEAAEDTKKETVEEKAAESSTKAESAEEAKEEASAEEVPEMTEATQKEAMEEALESVGGAKISSKTVTGSIPVKVAATGTEAVDNGLIAYGVAPQYKKGNYYGYSQPVTFSGKGTVAMAVNNLSDNPNSSSYIYYGIYKDEALTTPVDSYNSVAAGATTTRVFKIPAAGSYYIGLYSITSNTSYTYAASVAAIYYSGADRTISNGRQIAVGQKDAQTNYFKFTAVADGYITAYGDSSAVYNKVAILNSAKKALSGNTYMRYNPTYGVKKGTTYYIRVTSSYNSDGGYVFKVTNSAIKEKSGKKKAKAVTIKKGKTKKGTIVAGSSQADWYKFKLTKKKTVKITMGGRTNDTFKITVYKGGRKVGSRTYTYTTTSLTLKSLGKWTKGTYYIKIQRANSTSSGWYSLKWK